MVGSRHGPTASTVMLLCIAFLFTVSFQTRPALAQSEFDVGCRHYFTFISRSGNEFTFECKDGSTSGETVRNNFPTVSTIAWVESAASSPMNITCPERKPIQSRVKRREHEVHGLEWVFSCQALPRVALSCVEQKTLVQDGGPQTVQADEPGEFVRISSADLDKKDKPIMHTQLCTIDCTDGYGFNAGTGSCVCPAGSFKNVSAAGTPCTLCPLDMFNGAQDQTACQQCPDGQYTPGRGARNCSVCDSGKYLDTETRLVEPCLLGHQCFNCDKVLCDTGNTYQDERGSFSCKLCPDSVTYNRTTCAVDTTAPVITISDERVKGDVLIHDPRGPLPNITATAFDAFDGPLPVTQSNESAEGVVVLRAEDSAQNAATKELRVLSPDETRPVIVVSVDTAAPFHVELDTSFVPPPANVEDHVDGHSAQLQDQIAIRQQPSVDASVTGTYLVTYSLPVPNSMSLFAANVTLTVVVSDTTAPTAADTGGPLHMEAQDPLIVDIFPDVLDASNVTVRVLSNLSQLLPSSVPATVEVLLLLNDTAGNNSTVTQEYLVQDTRPPTFTSLPTKVYYCDGAKWDDIGEYAVRHTTAIDAWDASVFIVVIEPVALNLQEQYLVELNATDSSGNNATATAVMDEPTTIPVTRAVLDWTTGSVETAPTLPDPKLILKSFTPTSLQIPHPPSCAVARANVSADIVQPVPLIPPNPPPWFTAERAGTFDSNMPSEVVWDTCSEHNGTGTLYVQDTSLPIIQVAGGGVMVFEVQAETAFTDPGVRVRDAWYGDVSDFACVSVTAKRLLESSPRSVRRNAPFASFEEAEAGHVHVEDTSPVTGGFDLISTYGPSGVYTFTLEYTVGIPRKNNATATRAVVPVDTRPPILEWHVLRLEWPFGFSAPLRTATHFSAWDAADGDVSMRVNASDLAHVKPREPGTYNVTASVRDRAGNAAHQNFTVAVKQPSSRSMTASAIRLGVLLFVSADAVDALDAAAYQDWLALAPVTPASTNVHDGASILGTGSPDDSSIVSAERYGVATSLADVWVVGNISRVQVYPWMYFPTLIVGRNDSDGSTGAAQSTSQPSTFWDCQGRGCNGRPANATPGTTPTTTTSTTPNVADDADPSVPSTTVGPVSNTTGNGTALDRGRSISAPTGSPSTVTTTATQGQTTLTSNEGEGIYVLLEVVAHNSTTAAMVDPLPSAKARVLTSKVVRPGAPFFSVAIHRLEEIQAVLASTTTTTTTTMMTSQPSTTSVTAAPATASSTTATPSSTTTASSSTGSAASIGSTTVSNVDTGGSAAGAPVIPIAAGAGGGILLLCLVVVALVMRRRRVQREPKFTEPNRELTGVFANPMYKGDQGQQGPPPHSAPLAWDEPASNTSPADYNATTPEERAFHDRRWNQSHYDIHAPNRDYLEPVVGGADAEYATPAVRPYGTDRGDGGRDGDAGDGELYSRPLVLGRSHPGNRGHAAAAGNSAGGKAKAMGVDEGPHYSVFRGEVGMENPAFVGMRSRATSEDDGEWQPPLMMQSEYVEPPNQLQQGSELPLVNATYANTSDVVAPLQRSGDDGEVDA